MTLELTIASNMIRFAGYETTFAVDLDVGASPLDAVRAVTAEHPQLHGRVFGDTGSLQPSISIFVDDTHCIESALAAPIPAGAKSVAVVSALAGG